MFGRADDLDEIRRRLRRQPIVGILGPRQIGKTTVARELAARAGGNVSYFDLESPATHQGAEVDLLVVHGSKRLGFEFKHTVAPEMTKSMRIAIADLNLARLDVIHLGKDTYPLTNRIRAVAFERLQEDIPRLR